MSAVTAQNPAKTEKLPDPPARETKAQKGSSAASGAAVNPKDEKKVMPPAPPPPASSPGVVTYLFDGNELPRDWKIVNPDPNRWTMQPKRKSVMLSTQVGSCDLGKDLKSAKNLLLLDKPLPPEDFELIVMASIKAQHFGNELGLVLFSDEANYFWMHLRGDNYLYFQKVAKGASVAEVANQRPGYNLYLKLELLLVCQDVRF